MLKLLNIMVVMSYFHQLSAIYNKLKSGCKQTNPIKFHSDMSLICCIVVDNTFW